MKKVLLMTIFMVFLAGMLCEEFDFCDHTVLVVVSSEFSEFNSSLDAGFFGDFEKVSVENITIIYNENAINSLTESISRGEREFNSIYEITLPTNDEFHDRMYDEDCYTIAHASFTCHWYWAKEKNENDKNGGQYVK